MTRRAGLALLLLLLVLAAVETLSYAVSGALLARGVFYQPQAVDDYAGYVRARDPVLGWPTRLPDASRDETGSRIVPAFPDTRASCVSLYGDSWTWAGDRAEETWGNLLSQRLGCRVSNYGVGGYGSDQAYLRFLGNEADGAPVVLLGHLAENILRNLNQLRGLVAPGTKYGLKPRFALAQDGGLEQIPLPTPSESEFRDLVSHPERYLRHEYFLPGGPSGTAFRSFPYTVSVLGAFRHFHVLAELRREPWHAAFYSPDHPSQGLELTARILEAFHREASRRGKLPVLAVIPTGLDLEYHHRQGRWVYQSLLDRVASRGLHVLNLGDGMLAEMGATELGAYFEEGDVGRHPNAKGYAVMARVVEARLEEDGLVARRGLRSPSGPRR